MDLLRPYRVLVVEDEPFVQEFVASVLRQRGFIVMQAFDGDQGWAMFKTHQPDAVISDIYMPGIDGYRLCRNIREKGDATPVLFLTNQSELSSRNAAIEAGADDFLTKPVDPFDLEGRLWVALRRRTPVTKK